MADRVDPSSGKQPSDSSDNGLHKANQANYSDAYHKHSDAPDLLIASSSASTPGAGVPEQPANTEPGGVSVEHLKGDQAAVAGGDSQGHDVSPISPGGGGTRPASALATDLARSDIPGDQLSSPIKQGAASPTGWGLEN